MTTAGLLIQSGTLTADGRSTACPIRLDATGFSPHGSWKADGGGVLDGASGAYAATFEGQAGCVTPTSRPCAPATLKLGDHEQSLNLLANVGGGKARSTRGKAAAHCRLRPISRRQPGAAGPGFRRSLRRRDRLRGQGERLDGVLQAKLAGAGEKARPRADARRRRQRRADRRDRHHRRPAGQRAGSDQPRPPGAAGRRQRRRRSTSP